MPPIAAVIPNTRARRSSPGTPASTQRRRRRHQATHRRGPARLGPPISHADRRVPIRTSASRRRTRCCRAGTPACAHTHRPSARRSAARRRRRSHSPRVSTATGGRRRDPRSSPIGRKATLTIVKSSAVMKNPTDVSASTRRARRGSRPAAFPHEGLHHPIDAVPSAPTLRPTVAVGPERPAQ